MIIIAIKTQNENSLELSEISCEFCRYYLVSGEIPCQSHCLRQFVWDAVLAALSHVVSWRPHDGLFYLCQRRCECQRWVIRLEGSPFFPLEALKFESNVDVLSRRCRFFVCKKVPVKIYGGYKKVSCCGSIECCECSPVIRQAFKPCFCYSCLCLGL